MSVLTAKQQVVDDFREASNRAWDAELDARERLSRAQSAYAKARKNYQHAQLDYVEMAEAIGS